MIYVSPLEKQPTADSRDLLSVSKTDLNVCPATASSADFLQLMDGWL